MMLLNDHFILAVVRATSYYVQQPPTFIATLTAVATRGVSAMHRENLTGSTQVLALV